MLPIVIDEIILPDYEKWYIPTERQSGWRNTWSKHYESSYNFGNISEFITALTNSYLLETCENYYDYKPSYEYIILGKRHNGC